MSHAIAAVGPSGTLDDRVPAGATVIDANDAAMLMLSPELVERKVSIGGADTPRQHFYN